VKNTKTRKLALKNETLRNLQVADLGRVVGGESTVVRSLGGAPCTHSFNKHCDPDSQ
jgi:hypothetical protein